MCLFDSRETPGNPGDTGSPDNGSPKSHVTATLVDVTKFRGEIGALLTATANYELLKKHQAMLTTIILRLSSAIISACTRSLIGRSCSVCITSNGSGRPCALLSTSVAGETLRLAENHGSYVLCALRSYGIPVAGKTLRPAENHGSCMPCASAVEVKKAPKSFPSPIPFCDGKTFEAILPSSNTMSH